MNNQEKFGDNIDLQKLLSELDESEVVSSMSEFVNKLDNFYSFYNINTDLSLMRVFRSFGPDNFNDHVRNFVADALEDANYSQDGLRGDHVVLFSEPVILSEIECSLIPDGENEGAIRLISYKGEDKKIITKRYGSLYKINSLVHGFILPKRCSLNYVKLVRYFDLHTDYERLQQAERALQYVIDMSQIQIQNVQKKFEDIDSLIKTKRDEVEAVKGDIQVLEQKKSHVSSSIVNSQNTLKSARDDLKQVTEEYQKQSIDLNDDNQKLKKVKQEIATKTKEYTDSQNRLEKIQVNIIDDRKALKDIQEELATARREKNLTTFDTIGHSKETARQLRSYYIFASLTFFSLVCMAIYIFKNGESFMETLPYLVHISAWDILLSRLPLVTATTLIIGGLSGVFFFLIKHIVSLNTEKMTMLKAGILAEQITNSLDCEDMPEEKILEFKRDTKIKLILQVFSKGESEVDSNNMLIEVLKAINSK